MERSQKPDVRNPLLALASAKALQDLPAEAKQALRVLLLNLRKDASSESRKMLDGEATKPLWLRTGSLAVYMPDTPRVCSASRPIPARAKGRWHERPVRNQLRVRGFLWPVGEVIMVLTKEDHRWADRAYAEELLAPCHGCYDPNSELGTEGDAYQICCPACGARGPVGDTPQSALEGWNALPRQMKSTSQIMAICRGENMKKDEIQGSELREMLKDALRYRRLRILGAAPGGSIHSEIGTVIRYDNLDDAIDEDIEEVPYRGETLWPSAEPRDPATVIDWKFIIFAVNPANGKVYTEENSLLLCAKDAAVPDALETYGASSDRRGSNPEHVVSAGLLRERVIDFQTRAGGGRVHDTLGEELPRCLRGEGV